MTTPNNPNDITMNIPTWMTTNTVGLNFIDPDGDLCVLLGEATYWDYYYDPAQPNNIIFAYRYKNCWSLGNLLEQDQEWLDNCKPTHKFYIDDGDSELYFTERDE